MAAKSPVWAIEVGQCALKAMKVQAVSDQQLELLAFDLIEHENILSQADADATAMINKSIQTFAQRNDLKGSKVAIAVPGQQTLTRFTKMPPVEAKKIPDMVQYEAGQQIPFDMDEVVWDYQIFQDKDSPDVEVGIFAIRRELIRNYVAYFTEHGIEPMLVQTSPMASYNAAKFESVQGEGESVVLLDMGALATDLIVMEGNRIWARPIPIGGNKFTDSLVAAFKISFPKAEKLKRTAATSKYARQVFAAMRPVFADLVSEVQRSVGFYTSTHREANITKVVGMGNAFKLPNLQKFLQQNLQLDAQRLNAFKKMNTAIGDSSPQFSENVSSFAVCYGLAIQALGLAQVQSSLLPLEVQKTLLWRKKRPWFAAAAACLALSAGALWVGNVMANGEVKRALGDKSATAIYKTPEEAERALSSLGSESPPGERAAKVVAAANKLKAALDEVDRGKKGDQELFKRMAKLTENNIYVPRIVDVINRTFADVEKPEIREAKSGLDYVQVAKQTPRPQRGEVWIEKLAMYYDPKSPEMLAKATYPEGKKGSANKAGWLVSVVGYSPNPQLATWLEETLKPALEKNGRVPNRGIYIDQIALDKVVAKTIPIKTEEPDYRATEDSPVASRGGGRISLGQAGGGSEETSTGRGGGRIADPSASAATPAAGKDAISNWKQIARTEDVLTREKITEDKRFIMYLVVRKGDTPANLIPDEFKPKKAEPEKGKPGDKPGAAKPPAKKGG
ncbi:MAG TPA: type IV pilus assembly protein PilM [Phycisphaerae bacterium]|nr:type IV pilus assembly protein PilM [Phycisphaerae bacterium]